MIGLQMTTFMYRIALSIFATYFLVFSINVIVQSSISWQRSAQKCANRFTEKPRRMLKVLVVNYTALATAYGTKRCN